MTRGQDFFCTAVENLKTESRDDEKKEKTDPNSNAKPPKMVSKMGENNVAT